MKIIITPTLLVVADYDGDELVVPLYPHEYSKLIEIEILTQLEQSSKDNTFVDLNAPYKRTDFYKYVNTVIRTAYKDGRRQYAR